MAPSRARGDAGSERPARSGAARPPREKLPVITIARAKHRAEALAGLERWKARYPAVVAHLAPEHVLIDTNRGKSSAWYRVRINLRNVPEAERPPPEPPDPDYDWKSEYAGWEREADGPPADEPGDATGGDRDPDRRDG